MTPDIRSRLKYWRSNSRQPGDGAVQQAPKCPIHGGIPPELGCRGQALNKSSVSGPLGTVGSFNAWRGCSWSTSIIFILLYNVI
jgi:hypothetical protein